MPRPYLLQDYCISQTSENFIILVLQPLEKNFNERC